MISTRFCTLVLVSIGSATLAAQDAKKIPSAEAGATRVLHGAPRFAWPVPSSVIVTDTTTKKGKRAKMRYTLRLARHADGELRLSFRDFAFLEMNGRDVTGPRYEKALAPALAQASAIPDFAITESGVYQRTVGLDEMIERVMVATAKQRNASEAEIAKLRSMASQPQFEAAMQAAMSKYWNTWVGSWLRWDVREGKTAQAEVMLPFSGVQLPATMTMSHLGSVSDKPGYVQLQIVTVSKGEKARAAFVKGMEKMMSNAKPQGSSFAAEIGTVESKTTVRVQTKLSDLKPSSALYEHKLSVESKKTGEIRRQIERREYVFDWGGKK